MNRGSIVVMGIGIIAVVALVTSLIGLISGYVVAEQPTTGVQEKYTYLTVSGYGEVSFVPDRAVITFVSLGYGKTASEALEKCSSKTSSIIRALESIGIGRGDMETVGVVVNPRYDWEQKPPQIIDYEASYTLEVDVKDIDLVGRVIDTAFSAGADRMYGLQFTISDEKKEQLTLDAIRSAVADARAKAEGAASALGLRVVMTESVDISPQYIPPIMG
ncbi:MAG: SIMPL domain-containing protein, partial [Aigarchaeota archaeon]|nr:SIMPL domain-containing protein [Aigarchaeota archaeon]